MDRLGRLWQTLILTRWRPLFAHVPVESLVHAHQSAYYRSVPVRPRARVRCSLHSCCR